MISTTLTPQWDIRDTRLLGALVLVLLGMTAVAGMLRVLGRTDRGRKLADDFAARTLGWWIVILVFIPGVLAGGIAVLGVCALLGLLAWREFAGIAAWPLRPRDWVWAGPAALAPFLAVAGALPGPAWWPAAAAVAVVAVATRATAGPAWSGAVRWRLFGFGYAVLLLAAAPAIAFRFGTERLFFIVVVVQAGDVLQYACGKLCGRRPLAPALSPHKTWEGLLGGLAATAALGAGLAPLTGDGWLAGLGWGAALGVAGTAGGLAMSAVKRSRGVKDFGRLLPGHGGVMDRLDSLNAAVAAAYVWLVC